MAVGWCFAPYARRDPAPGRPGRYCVMDDYSELIFDDGGAWAESEVLGGWAICKVRATAATLQTIADDPRMRRIPNRVALTETLSDLTTAQRNALRDFIVNDLGYPLAELQAALGNNLGTRTLGQVLRFVCRRRLKPRYVSASDAIVLDGPEQACRTPESVDAEV